MPYWPEKDAHSSFERRLQPEVVQFAPGYLAPQFLVGRRELRGGNPRDRTLIAARRAIRAAGFHPGGDSRQQFARPNGALALGQFTSGRSFAAFAPHNK